MNGNRWWLWLILVLVLGIVIFVVWRQPTPDDVPTNGSATGRPTGPSGPTGPKTKMEIEMYGGFAFVSTLAEHRLEVAYLNDTKVTGCDVDQPGTELMVVEGNITSASPPPNKKFDLEGATVTFPALDSANLQMSVHRNPGPPNRPDPRELDAHWVDTKWVPQISTYSPGSSLHPQWRDMVNGRLVLRGGFVKGLRPSNNLVKEATFQFKRGGAVVFEQAMTDRVGYDVDVPGTRIVIHKSVKGVVTVIEVEPEKGNGPVRLKLMIKPDGHGSDQVNPGDPVGHFCAFYQLLQPIPQQADWLVPHYVPGASLGGGTATGGKPLPGFFCPGDWF